MSATTARRLETLSAIHGFRVNPSEDKPDYSQWLKDWVKQFIFTEEPLLAVSLSKDGESFLVPNMRLTKFPATGNLMFDHYKKDGSGNLGNYIAYPFSCKDFETVGNENWVCMQVYLEAGFDIYTTDWESREMTHHRRDGSRTKVDIEIGLFIAYDSVFGNDQF
jgi:hypothetical protein